MSIDVTTVSVPINVSASGTKVEATVSGQQIAANFTGGIGPQGPPGPQGESGASSVAISGGSSSPLVLEITQQVST